MFFLAMNFCRELENKCEFFVCGKTTFLCSDKDHTLTYQRSTDFIMSFTYLGFLDTRLSLDLSLYPIHLVLRYRVTFGSMFYQT
jgi:hypothetical protein